MKGIIWFTLIIYRRISMNTDRANTICEKSFERPLIGISCAWSEETWGYHITDGGFYYIDKDYAKAVHTFGGIPIMLPPIYEDCVIEKEAIEILDALGGIIFAGGGHCSRFTHETLPILREQQPVRSFFEEALIREAYYRDMPVMGFCRGHQMIAEIFGGTIDSSIIQNHKQKKPYNKPCHSVILLENTKLNHIVGVHRWQVNSIHVQRVGRIPDGFRVAALSEDDSIEAIEAIDRTFFIGLQFHPEKLVDSKSMRLFEKFIDTAKKYQRTNHIGYRQKTNK